ncbi:Gfo/Idh/MocA family oxidoreductase [bacterium]|nr:Gfo/Idh/MocA family oxidoreductase [bacterium]
MGKEFKFVIVGSGNIVATYITAIREIPCIAIAGIVSRSKKRPKALVGDKSVEITDSLEKIARDFDAVILTTPNGLHHEGAIQAAKLGKHVLTEKPLDISIKAMDYMINTCRQKNVKLGVSYQRRMSPDNITMKKILDEKKLGKVFASDLSVKFYRGQDYYDSAPYRGTWNIDGGGPFMQQASHNIDIYCWFFGKPVKAVSLLGTFAHNIETEDHGAALLKHSNGMIGTIIASTVAKPGFPARLEIHAEAGTIIMENDIITTWAVKRMENPSTAGEAKIHNGASSASVTDTAGHEAILTDFVKAVKEDRDPAVTGESARIATETILRIYNSQLERATKDV